MIRLSFAWIGLILICWMVGCSSGTTGIREGGTVPRIRVCLSENQNALSFRVLSEFSLRAGSRNIYNPKKGNLVRVESDGSTAFRLFVENTNVGMFSSALFTVEEEGGAVFVFQGVAFRGTMRCIVSNGKIYLVNELDIETYLKGVVPNEIGKKKESDLEAIKAQVVTARTYSLLPVNKKSRTGFDVYADTRDQVYTGSKDETAEISLAVDETRGTVLVNSGRLIDCFYHAACGGKTESIDRVWNASSPQSYLTLVDDSDGRAPFCSAFPDFEWAEEWSGEELEQIIRQNLAATNSSDASRLPSRDAVLKDIQITGRLPSGRVGILKVVFEQRGQTLEYVAKGDRTRYLLRRPKGQGILRSSLFQIEIKRDAANNIVSVKAKGKGNGHGIGLCQWGAIGMAREGYKVGEILEHYFRGTSVVRMY
jgi:stage II sporulation protein D